MKFIGEGCIIQSKILKCDFHNNKTNPKDLKYSENQYEDNSVR